MPRLENWWVRFYYQNPFLAPEENARCLAGELYGDARYPDGKKVKTSGIAKCEGLEVTTESGSVYELGRPHPEYLEWLEKEGLQFDEAQPIKFKHKPASSNRPG